MLTGEKKLQVDVTFKVIGARGRALSTKCDKIE